MMPEGKVRVEDGPRSMVLRMGDQEGREGGKAGGREGRRERWRARRELWDVNEAHNSTDASAFFYANALNSS